MCLYNTHTHVHLHDWCLSTAYIHNVSSYMNGVNDVSLQYLYMSTYMSEVNDIPLQNTYTTFLAAWVMWLMCDCGVHSMSICMSDVNDVSLQHTYVTSSCMNDVFATRLPPWVMTLHSTTCNTITCLFEQWVSACYIGRTLKALWPKDKKPKPRRQTVTVPNGQEAEKTNVN